MAMGPVEAALGLGHDLASGCLLLSDTLVNWIINRKASLTASALFAKALATSGSNGTKLVPAR